MGTKRYAALVLSAGAGRRMNSDVPKQYMDLCGYPVIYYSLKAFEESAVDTIVLVAGVTDIEYCRKEIVDRYHLKKVAAVVAGGAERYLSVYEGLKAVDADYVLIHDGARPLLDQASISLSMREVQRENACVLAVPVKDTIKVADQDGYVTATPDRNTLWAMQTPQSFSCRILRAAYEELFRRIRQAEPVPDITDDAMVVEYALSQKVKLIQGSYRNLKITTPEDLRSAEMFLKSNCCNESFS